MDEHGKGTMGCGSGMGLLLGLIGEWGRERKTQKTLYSGAGGTRSLCQGHSPGGVTV